MITFRRATRDDVVAIVALLRDDALGAGREGAELGTYRDVFDLIDANPMHALVVGEVDGTVAACYQLTFLDGLSLSATRRGQIEGVRVSSSLRGGGYGRALIADAETRCRAAGCSLLQLTTNRTRERAHAFYEQCGFEPSHIGFKKPLV